MILVTVGTHNQSFNRLIQSMDEVATLLDEQVVIQRGSSSYEPKHAKHFQFTSSQHMVRLTKEARIIVTHAGAGAIILALHENKPLVVVPRLQRFGEAVDDHQQQLAIALESQGHAAVVYRPSASNLRLALNQAIQRVAHDNNNNRSTQLVKALRQQLNEWSGAEMQPKVPNRNEI